MNHGCGMAYWAITLVRCVPADRKNSFWRSKTPITNSCAKTNSTTKNTAGPI